MSDVCVWEGGMGCVNKYDSLVGVQVGEVGLADDHIVGGRVGVQLLVPLLEETLVDALMEMMRGGECEQVWDQSMPWWR